MPTFNLYRQAQLSAWLAGVSWTADNIVASLHTTAYVPNLDLHRFVSDLTAELPAGGGYVTGGQPLAGRTASYVPAASWPDVWAPVTGYAVGQVIRPAMSPAMLYRCTAGGTSGSSVPSWPLTAGATVADGTVTWAAIAPGAATLGASALQWASFTATFRYVVLSDRTPATAAAQPLIAIADMGGSASGSGGNLDVLFDSGSGSGIVIPLWAQ